MLDFLVTAFALKEEPRTGWLLRGVREPESVADHSWGTALLCLAYAREAGVDTSRAALMAVIHDIAEAITGDHATRVARMDDPEVSARKRMREQAAMEQLRDLISPAATVTAGQIRELWDEYEARSTPVARFVRDMNLIDMCLQAYRYEREGDRYDEASTAAEFPDYGRLEEFFATTRPRLSTSVGSRLFADLYDRYASLSQSQQR
jgi:putative hydrolases of HD superfamily